MKILTSLLLFNDVTSSVLAAITAYLYFWLPDVQNSHGRCVFHFSLNVALMHAVLVLYKITTRISLIFRQYCMTEVYVLSFLVAAVHTWSVILSYNTWKQVKQIRQEISHGPYPTRRRLNWYLYFGYGVSILYVVLMICHRIMSRSIIFYHSVTMLSTTDCSIEIEYGEVLPSLVSILLNNFYFASSQRRLLKLSTDITLVSDEKSITTSHTTKLKYKIYLNLKLCLTMNIPIGLNSLMFVLVVIISDNYNSLLDLFLKVNFFLASLQGTFIFLVAVAFRKPVIQSFIKHRRKSCLGWLPVPECLIRPSTNDKEDDDETGKDLEEITVATSLQSLGNEDGI